MLFTVHQHYLKSVLVARHLPNGDLHCSNVIFHISLRVACGHLWDGCQTGNHHLYLFIYLLKKINFSRSNFLILISNIGRCLACKSNFECQILKNLICRLNSNTVQMTHSGMWIVSFEQYHYSNDIFWYVKNIVWTLKRHILVTFSPNVTITNIIKPLFFL